MDHIDRRGWWVASMLTVLGLAVKWTSTTDGAVTSVGVRAPRGAFFVGMSTLVTALVTRFASASARAVQLTAEQQLVTQWRDRFKGPLTGLDRARRVPHPVDVLHGPIRTMQPSHGWRDDVQAECLRTALALDERFGISGGLTSQECRRLPRAGRYDGLMRDVS